MGLMGQNSSCGQGAGDGASTSSPQRLQTAYMLRLVAPSLCSKAATGVLCPATGDMYFIDLILWSGPLVSQREALASLQAMVSPESPPAGSVCTTTACCLVLDPEPVFPAL